MRIKDIQVIPYSIPYRKPNKSNWSQRKGATCVLVKIVSEDDIVGFGETVCFQSAQMGAFLLNKMKPLLIGHSCYDIERLKIIFNQLGGWNWNHETSQFANPLLATIEMACWDIMGKSYGVPLNKLFGGKLKSRSEVVYLLPPGSIEEVASEADKAVRDGYRTVFYKLSKNTIPSEDVEYVREIRNAIGTNINLRIDANGSWTIPMAIRTLRKLEEYDIEFCEQPVIGIDGLRQVREQVPIPIGANEAACSLENVMEIIRKEAADVIVTDHHNLGGLLALKKAASMAEIAGIPIVMHANGESSIGYQAGLQVLATCPNFKYANQYFGNQLSDDIADRKMVVKDGFIDVLDLPGIGLNADPQKLKKYSELYAREGEYSAFEVTDKDYLPIFPKY